MLRRSLLIIYDCNFSRPELGHRDGFVEGGRLGRSLSARILVKGGCTIKKLEECVTTMTNNTFKNSELGAQSYILAGQGEKNYSSHDELLARAFRDHKPVSRSADDGEDFTGLIATKSVSEGHTNVSDHTPTIGELDLEARSSLRSLTRGSEIHATDQDDGYDVEYRKLRLERVILVGVWTKGTTAEIEANMNELASLAETAGADVVEVLYQKRDKPDPGTYIGSGKVSELKEIVSSTVVDTVICDGELSPSQMIALEKALDVKVIDRTMLILDIFAQHAKSKEGKAQVSLAQMEYLITRVRGWGGALSRQAGGRAGSNGGVGLRGPGETKIEADRRRLRSDMAKLRKEIAGMKTAREVKRSQRKQSTIPQIAIAGYTNAGKSSLINAMTGAGVLVEDALFATLDPTTRRAELADGRAVVFTDTVGFVRHLPTQLVESFRSTLEEVVDADLVLHVVDGSDPFPLKQIEAVNTVVSEIVRKLKVDAPPEIIVVNKIDQADPLVLAELRHALDDVVFVSAKTAEGIPELEMRVEQFLNTLDTHVRLLVPYTRGDIVSRLHSNGTVLSEEYEAEGTLIDVRLPAAIAAELGELRVD
ncbi:GTPase HflX [Corynebacterium diphtheriae]|nr:GTPase HflX [Corynebacterium diphtheriae]